MATVTKPIALDESINTTEQTPRNIADVLAEELKGIADSITTAESVEDILSDMATTKDAQVISGTAVFDTVDGNLVKALKVEIVPSQAGSGTPSPSNIRPISGHTEEVISVKDSTDTTQETYTTPFNQTVYGGTLDVLTGELMITHGIVDLGDLNWQYQSSSTRFMTTDLSNSIKNVYNPSIIKCEGLNPNVSPVSARDIDATICPYSNGYIYACLFQYTDATAFKTAMSGIHLVYELATPTTISLTPQTVKSLVGENHIQASTGDVTECKFSMLINGDDLEMLLS